MIARLRNIDIPLLVTFYSNRVCNIAVFCCSCQVKISGSVYRPNFFVLVTRKVFFIVSPIFIWPQGELFTWWSRVVKIEFAIENVNWLLHKKNTRSNYLLIGSSQMALVVR